MTIRWSFNSGVSWEKDTLPIWQGPSGYSSMTTSGNKSNEQHLYLVYEKGHVDTTESISFVKIRVV